MAKNNDGLRRRTDIKAVGGLYKKKFRWLTCCVYCGQQATTMDHVLPISRAAVIDFSHPLTRARLFQGLNKVPCCKECNSIASNHFFTSIRAKREFIQKRLHKKYQKKLRAIMWDDDEMEGIDYTLRCNIEKMLHNRIILERRIMFPATVKGHKIHSTKSHLFMAVGS